MKPADPLSRRLARLTVPPPDPEARGRALHRATLALQNASPAAKAVGTASRPWLARFGWLPLSSVVAVVLILAFWRMGGREHAERLHPSALAAERTVLSQMEALFGSQLDAVIESTPGTPDIRLDPDPASATAPSLAQPIFIQFEANKKGTRVRVLSYSGRQVCVDLAGRRLCFQPLVTGQGEIILEGDHFCWTSAQSKEPLAGYRVTARSLPAS